MGYKEHFILALAATAITTLILGIFVIFQDRKNKLFLAFSLYSLSISWWCFSQIGNVYGPSLEASWFWARFEHIGVVFIPTFFLHFTVLLLGLKNKGMLLKVCYLISAVTASTFPTSLISPSAEKKVNGLINFGEPGIIYPFILIFFALLTVYCLIKIFTAQRQATGSRKTQLGILFWSSVIGYIGGSFNFFLVYDISVYPLNPFGTYFVALYVLATFYAIFKYNLLGIEVIIKKTLVFAGLSAFVVGVFVAATFITQELLGSIIGIPKVWTYVVSALLIAALIDPIKNFLVNITNKYLFQKKYNPTQLIKTFTDDVISLMDLDRLVRTTVTTLADTLKLESSAILLLNKDEDKHVLRDSYGVKDVDEINLSVDSSLAKYLSRTGEVLLRKEDSPNEIKEDMDKVNAALALPLILHKQMIGVITLGKKRSDQDYTEEDIDILTALTKAETIALSNARLFTEAKQNVKLAAIGALAAGINHEVCNPLNRMMSAMQIFWKSVDLGLYKDKSEEELLQMSRDVMNDAMNDIRKIASITRKLSDFAKPSRDAIAEKINIVESLQETLGVLGHEIKLKRIEFIKDAKDPLFIMADRDQIQEIFFNIIRNAIQAVKENGKISFSAQKKENKIIIDITDTGLGISKDKIQKIYDPFYTTKAETKGTGLGLAIVRQLVNKNRGDISVRSQIGRGTTFTLEFPRSD
ncbi:MAG: GAF domain-containing protein [Candidatus Omnitrophica bacterium]|nr:GAF domain-containing protein [Candidatus Omnitrophota bacterium]